MQFRDGVHVFSADHKDLGRIERVVIDPRTRQVSHVVVRQGLIFSEDKVIPIDLFHSATEQRAVLRQEIDNLQKLPHFEETHYVPLDEAEIDETEAESGAVSLLYWYPPAGMVPHHAPTLYGTPAYPAVADQYYVRHTEQHIPEGSVALKEGAGVFSVDGEHVGDIERVIVDADLHDATHIVISKGLLLKERKLVPTAWFSKVEAGEVHLAVHQQLLDNLPDYEEAS